MKRVVIPELLDTDSGTPADIATTLSDLRHINRWFGGIAATQAMIAQVARRDSRCLWRARKVRNNIPAAASGKRVLVVGAGPAGLSAAYHLARLGHSVAIREVTS
jgi:heterodisulfide reductase subunit A-like polyferredoxin